MDVLNKALIDAAAKGDVTQCCELLAGGANVNAHEAPRWTPLLAAISSKSIELVRFLIDSGADARSVCDDSGETPLSRAVTLGLPDITQLLIERGADLTFRFKGNERTLLMVAAVEGREKICEILLKNGCRVDEATSSNWTALHFAAFAGRDGVLSLLMRHAAKLDGVSATQPTALHVAVRGAGNRVSPAVSYVDVCRILVDGGLSPRFVPEGWSPQYLTPMQEAIKEDLVGIVRFFVEEVGESIEQQTQDDRTTDDLTAASPRVAAYVKSLRMGTDIVAALEGEIGAAPGVGRKAGYSPL